VKEDTSDSSRVSISETTDVGPPPDYSPSSPSAGPSNITHASSSLPPASNYTHIDRQNGKIRGVYVIDPSLVIPDSLLPPLEEGQTDRPNLVLKGHQNSIDVDVHLVLPADAKNIPERVIIEITNHYESTTVRLHNTLPIPVTLKVVSEYRYASLYLPRSFRGLVIQTIKHGKITFSDATKHTARTFSEVDGKSISFIGDTAGEGWDVTGQNWLGSKIEMSSKHSNVGIWYTDELEQNKTNESETLSSVIKKRGISGLFWSP
jgi:hypothetical protein